MNVKHLTFELFIRSDLKPTDKPMQTNISRCITNYKIDLACHLTVCKNFLFSDFGCAAKFQVVFSYLSNSVFFFFLPSQVKLQKLLRSVLNVILITNPFNKLGYD